MARRASRNYAAPAVSASSVTTRLSRNDSSGRAPPIQGVRGNWRPIARRDVVWPQRVGAAG